MEAFKKNLQELGYHKFENVLSTGLVDQLRVGIDKSIEQDKISNISRGNYSYLSHNRGGAFVELLETSPLQNYVDEVMSNTCVLYSFSSISLEPNKDNLLQNSIHRDINRFCRPYLLCIQALYMIDDFIKENGATYVLPKSHLNEERPTDEEFYKNAIQIEGKAGDAVIFDSLLWHAGGQNKTNHSRRAITQGFIRSFMKQQIDLTKATDKKLVETLNERSKRLLGFNVRVPENMEQFLLPTEQRLYKPNQG
jgi:ectoine hydroxylase-related dioxygenase (phytanoyl-CoA dioxygenase family)